jgi:hypothetical protein
VDRSPARDIPARALEQLLHIGTNATRRLAPALFGRGRGVEHLDDDGGEVSGSGEASAQLAKPRRQLPHGVGVGMENGEQLADPARAYPGRVERAGRLAGSRKDTPRGISALYSM